MSASVFALCLFFDIPPVSANSCSRTKQTAKAKTETTATTPTTATAAAEASATPSTSVPSVPSVPSDLAKRMHSAIESGKELHQFSQKQLDDVFDFLIDNADNDTILGEIDADALMSAITVESESRDETVTLDNVDKITDEDFNNPFRNIVLPALSQKLLNLIGKKSKPVLLKKNILEKNKINHPDLSPQDCRENIGAIYNCDLIIQPNPNGKPGYFMLVSVGGKNKQSLLEISENKESFEIVNYHYLNDRQLQQKINRANKESGIVKNVTEGGLPSPTITQKGAAGSFSALPGNVNTIPPISEKSSTEDKKTPTLSDIKLSAPGKTGGVTWENSADTPALPERGKERSAAGGGKGQTT